MAVRTAMLLLFSALSFGCVEQGSAKEKAPLDPSWPTDVVAPLASAETGGWGWKTERYIVVRDSISYVFLYRWVTGGQLPPAVDFKQRAVLVAMSRQWPTGGYAVTMHAASHNSVHVGVEAPPVNAIVTQSQTRPFAFIELESDGGPIRIQPCGVIAGSSVVAEEASLVWLLREHYGGELGNAVNQREHDSLEFNTCPVDGTRLHWVWIIEGGGEDNFRESTSVHYCPPDNVYWIRKAKRFSTTEPVVWTGPVWPG